MLIIRCAFLMSLTLRGAVGKSLQSKLSSLRPSLGTLENHRAKDLECLRTCFGQTFQRAVCFFLAV